ncbi:sulfotransferase family 2 domain-containing protein [Oxalobacteraceae bacterium R-40]|uniref:Sulfotransferase family 2 domain-containing protein n=1 Tax=Keguizhuia sedimenti TaxID=3064264 RepID=A0ABU1BTB7_9BURK|nr:sulfotransferase family 2 domain-containing protein [Oxalobacteraceae bacterium R-40]
MLISFSKRFLFIANTKTASTTIERNLRRHADISISATRLGKHMSYSQVLKNFKFVFRKSGAAADEYFRFGVIREPVDWVVSWYNYRHRDQLMSNSAKMKKSTHGITFEEFVFEMMKPANRGKFAHIGNQLAKFTANDGSLGVDYLIPLSRVETELQIIATELGIKKAFPKEKKSANASPRVIGVNDVTPEIASKLRTYFAEDLDTFHRAESGAFGDPREIIRAKRKEQKPFLQEKETGSDDSPLFLV